MKVVLTDVQENYYMGNNYQRMMQQIMTKQHPINNVLFKLSNLTVLNKQIMYQNPLDHSNHRMLYSFTPPPYVSQSPYPIYPQMVDSSHYRPSPSPSPKMNQSRQVNFFHAQQPSSESNTEIKIRKDMKSLEEDYEKLFVGGDISDVSSNTRPKVVETKSISIEKYSQEMNILKEQYQRKIDYIQEQNQQNQRAIKQQYELYLDKLRQENTQLIAINKEYQSQIKDLMKKMEGFNLSDVNAYKNQNSRLKDIIKQLEDSRAIRNNSNSNSPKVIVETKVIENKEQVSYLNQELEKYKRIIESKDSQMNMMTGDIKNLNEQIATIKRENSSNQKSATKENDFLFQIERYKEIINKKNNQMGSITNIKTSLEKQILLLEQSIEELSTYKEKYYIVMKERDALSQSQTQVKRLLNDKVKEIEIFVVEKNHLMKKQQYLTSKISTLEQRYKTIESQLKDVRSQLDTEKRKRRQKLQSKSYEQYIQDMSETVKEFKTKMSQTQKMQENEKQIYGKQQQIMDSKFNQLALVLESKERQLGQMSANLDAAHNDIARQATRIKENEETIRTIRAQLDSKNETFESRRVQYQKSLIKLRSQAEIGYNKSIEQFKQKISRLEMELAERSPKKYPSNKHVRSPGKPKVGGSRRDSSKSVSNNGELRTEEFEERINEFLKYNKSQEVYQLLEQAKLELRYLLSQNSQLLSYVKVLENSKDLNNKSIIADDKIRFGQARLDYINQKNSELEERITILIAVNTQLKGRVEQANSKVQQLHKRAVEYQQKFEKGQEFTRQSIEKSKEEYDKLFQLHTAMNSKIPALQRTISELTRQIEHKNTTIRQLNNKTESQTTNIESKSSYFYNRINALNKDLQYAHQDIEQYKGKIWTLERDLSEASTEIEVLKDEVKGKQTELKILLTKNSEVSIDLNLKSEELAAHKLEIVTLKNTNEYLGQKLKTFAAEEQQKHEATTKQILNLHNQLEQSSLTLQSFKQHRETSEQAVKEAKLQITKLNNEITQLKFNLEKKERQLTQIKSTPAPLPRVESRGSNETYPTKNSVLLQQKLTQANNQISSLTNKTLSYQLSINKMKQAQTELEGKLMIVTQQLQSQASQKNQLQNEVNKVNEQMLGISRSSKQIQQIQRKQSGSSKQIFELERRLKIVNQQKQSLMKQLKHYVTQNHNQTSEKQDKLNIFLKQNLDATQLQLERASQTIFSLQASNEHYYTLIQEIPARYTYYINYMKKINSEFRYLVGELDLTSHSKNSEISTKLLNNISESLQIFEQIRHLEDQIESRIQDLEERKNV